MAKDVRYIKYTTFKHFLGSDYEITSKINAIHNTEVDRTRKGQPSILSARTSMKRAHKNLFEVLRSNEWRYFVTLTFDNIDYYVRCALSEKKLNFSSIFHYVYKEMSNPSFFTQDMLRERLHFLRDSGFVIKSGSHYSVTDRGRVHLVDRLDDEACRKKFTAWSNEMRLNFPSMKYVAVPEYHKNGGLHYHVVIGGVNANDLGLVDSGRVLHCGKSWNRDDFFANGYTVNVSNGEGMPIFNITGWKFNGFSTATEIRCSDAVAKYVGKYLSKADIDPRFYNKRRFHCSLNVTKPLVHRFEYPMEHIALYNCDDPCNRIYLDFEGLQPVYEDTAKTFASYELVEPDNEGTLLGRCFGIVPNEYGNAFKRQ